MQLRLDLQQAVSSDALPALSLFEKWVTTALKLEAEYSGHSLKDEYDLTIRIVDKTEIRQLNSDYRHHDKPTNVLSFPFESPPQLTLPLLGDIVICEQIVIEEAEQQNIPTKAHWAHMVIHGMLHLLGYDHMNTLDAEIMERLERDIMRDLGYTDPYACHEL